ncbi:MAG TPA: DnaJ domain-containing protein [Roseiflexaceae bacterium]|nr:DnaJ domain-containing protein [Roseiflexaceae bacterium]
MSDFEGLNHYELLGVSRTATPDEIKRAYRQEISKYHPDRFATAAPDQQEYASRRSQRLTEAYGVLSDLSARSAYNRGQPVRRTGAARRAPPPTQPRDHQAELYEQARGHMDAGRYMQAIGVLRQLQQINPFYKDSADLLAKAEAQLHARQQPAAGERPNRRPLLIAGGLIGGAAVIALVALAVGMIRNTENTIGIAGGAAPTSAAALIATGVPTTPPEPTALPAATNTVAAPTAPPTEPPSPLPTQPPSPLPTEAPPPTVPAPTQPAVIAEEGSLLFNDDFSGSGWADSGGAGWRVGYALGLYRIAVDAGYGEIWSYRTAQTDDYSLGVDVRAASGEGGLLLRFADAGNYLSYTVNPSQTSYRLEQRRGGGVTALAGGQSEAIQTGAEATNRLVARQRGSLIQLLINGQLVAEVDAPDAPMSRRFGLLAIGDAVDSELFFDNLQLRAIEN